MLYSEYMDQVKEIALLVNGTNGMTYIRPDYAYVLASSEIKLSDITDFDGVNEQIVLEHLKLERDMLNTQMDQSPIVMQWLSDVISTVVEPTIIDQQNKLIKDMIEYRKEKNSIDERTKELDLKQQALEDKSKILPLNFGMDFSKKKPK